MVSPINKRAFISFKPLTLQMASLYFKHAFRWFSIMIYRFISLIYHTECIRNTLYPSGTVYNLKHTACFIERPMTSWKTHTIRRCISAKEKKAREQNWIMFVVNEEIFDIFGKFSICVFHRGGEVKPVSNRSLLRSERDSYCALCVF